jgi:hypothetical protein
LNITGSPDKISAAFSLIMVLYVLGSFTMMFFYWKKSVDWRAKKHSHSDKFLDHDIALHSIMITNLSPDVSIKQMNINIKLVFEKIFTDKVISVKTIGKMD